MSCVINDSISGFGCLKLLLLVCICLLFQLTEDEWEHENIVLERVSIVKCNKRALLSNLQFCFTVYDTLALFMFMCMYNVTVVALQQH